MTAPASSSAPLPALSAGQQQNLQRDGFLLLRSAIPPAWLADLQALFDRSVLPSDQWPVPRGRDWRHALLDLEPQIQTLCRLPMLLAAAGALIGERFFLAQVEGREPLAGGGHQALHRDLSAQRPGDTVNALVFLDDYGPANGATRLVPASHRPGSGAAGDISDGAALFQLSGSAGDVLVFDADLLHAASCNHSGARRRTLLIGYQSEALYAQHLATAALRHVRMDCRERFDPVL